MTTGYVKPNRFKPHQNHSPSSRLPRPSAGNRLSEQPAAILHPTQPTPAGLSSAGGEAADHRTEELSPAEHAT